MTDNQTVWVVMLPNGDPYSSLEVTCDDALGAICHAVHTGLTFATGYPDWDILRIWPFNPKLLVGPKGGEMRPSVEVAAEHYGDAWYDWLGQPLPTASESTYTGGMA